MKSTITKIKDIKYSKPIIVDKIEFTRDTFNVEKSLFETTLKQIQNNKDEEMKAISNMFARWQFALFQNTLAIAVIKELKNNFDIEYDKNDVSEFMKKITSVDKNAKKDEVEKFVKNSIFSTLIWEYLANEWKITVSDEDANKFLDDYYQNTNNSIREFKNDKNKFEQIKKDIRFKKTIDELNKYFNVKLEINLAIKDK
ncbi:MAG: hypothetical protein LBS95_02010 [Mycoplasmataceae bacterium]|nr:hypothetical protein [Mycoplasmataceae bacterium]